MGVATFAGRLPADLRPDRRPRADPAGRAAPAAGLLRGRRAGRRQLDDARARPAEPPRATSPASPSAAPRPARSSPPRSFLPIAALPEEHAADLGLAGAVLAQRASWSSPASSSAARSTRRRSSSSEQRDRRRSPRLPARRCCSATTGATCCGSCCAATDRLGQHDLHRLRAVATPSNTVGLDAHRRCCGSACSPTSSRSSRSRCSATLADRIGRKPVFIAGSLGLRGADVRLPRASISTGNYALIFVIGILLFGLVYSATNGVWPAVLRRDVPRPGPAVRHGDRHPDRLRDRRLRAHDRRPRSRAGDGSNWLGGRDLHRRGLPGQRRRRGHRRATTTAPRPRSWAVPVPRSQAAAAPARRPRDPRAAPPFAVHAVRFASRPGVRGQHFLGHDDRARRAPPHRLLRLARGVGRPRRRSSTRGIDPGRAPCRCRRAARSTRSPRRGARRAGRARPSRSTTSC